MNHLSIETLIYLMLTIILWGLGPIFDKIVLKYISPNLAFYIRLAVMVVFFLIILLSKFNTLTHQMKNIPYQVYIYTFLSVLTAMAGVFTYLNAMKGEEASRIVPLSSTYPLITLLLAVIFMGEKFTLVKLLGTIFIAYGVYLISR